MNDNGTWSKGSQRGLENLPGGNADCGQYAGGNISGSYMVGSVSPNGGIDQPLAIRSPIGFDAAHGLVHQQFRIALIPATAQAVAYVNVQTRAFHYARISGGTITQTDANRRMDLGMGGTYAHFAPVDGKPSLDNFRGQRGAQPVRELQDLGQFVDYCNQHYDIQNGLFFFCRFS